MHVVASNQSKRGFTHSQIAVGYAESTFTLKELASTSLKPNESCTLGV